MPCGVSLSERGMLLLYRFEFQFFESEDYGFSQVILDLIIVFFHHHAFEIERSGKGGNAVGLLNLIGD